MAFLLLLFFLCASFVLGVGILVVAGMACSQGGQEQLGKFFESLEEANKKK
jgi:hypothetical protein